MKFKYFSTIVASLVVSVFGIATAAADVLETVKERGTLFVGVKADYKPYGFLDTSGAVIGIEPDLAKDVADKLGVELE
ncbi:MAG: transporter substrate-binding domain-containing protein [Roseobacter sp.]